MKSGATALLNNEKISAKVLNTGTINKDTRGDFSIVAKNNRDELMAVLYEEKDLLIHGDGTPTEITIDKWPEKSALTRTASIYAQLVYEDGGKTITRTCGLGEIKIIEKPSAIVTTGMDLENIYDGEISLREAIKYAKELGEKYIDISELGKTSEEFVFKMPLVIDSEITINGQTTKDGKLRCTPLGIWIRDPATIITITDTGNVTLQGIRFSRGFDSNDNLSFLKNEGGKLKLNQCVFDGFHVGDVGAMFALNGGKTDICRSDFENFSMLDGGELFKLSNGAELNMVNCLVQQNFVHHSVINNVDGKLNMFYCSLLINENPVKSVASVVSEEKADTNLVGCIIIHREPEQKPSLSGNIHAYATIYGSKDEQVQTDDLSKQMKTSDYFEVISKYGDIAYTMSEEDGAPYIRLPHILESAAKQVYIRNNKGKVEYSKDRKDWKKTGVSSDFPEEEFKVDILGENHLGFYGGYAPQIVEPDPDPVEPIDPPEKPDTGDSSSSLWLWIMIAAIACIVIAGRRLARK